MANNEDVLDSVVPENDVNGNEGRVENVLILAGIELISLTVASIMLCFGFVLERVLIIQGHL